MGKDLDLPLDAGQPVRVSGGGQVLGYPAG